MKKIGILGGLAWPSTIDYYRAICLLSQEYHASLDIPGPAPMPEMCIESVNINYSYNRRGRIGDEDSWREYDEYFGAALKRLEDSGADFIIMASNTPHNRFDAITRPVSVPVLSIFEAVADACAELGIRRFLLLGTEPTMNSGVFPRRLEELGISAFTPPDDRIKKMVADLISELMTGRWQDGRRRMKEIVDSSYQGRELDVKNVCLGCTELPLVYAGLESLETFEEDGMFFINTAMIHARAAFQYAVEF